MAAFSAMAGGLVFRNVSYAKGKKPRHHRIAIRDFVFEPALVRVSPGDTVTWTNFDIAPHTATANDESWYTGLLGQNEARELIVTDNTTPEYFCRFHPMMKGKLEQAK